MNKNHIKHLYPWSIHIQEGSIFTWILLYSHQFIDGHFKRGHTQKEHAQTRRVS